MGQDYRNLEHWIIDNRSSDQTVSLVKSMYAEAGREDQVHILSERDHGISDAFNKGLRKAAGEIIAILNSDDCYEDCDVLTRVAAGFQDPQVQIVHGNMTFVDSDHGSQIRRPLMCPITYAMPFNHPAFFVKADVYRQFGEYSLDYRFAMDFEFVCRLYRSSEELKVKAVYLNGNPLTRMYAGGASYVHEEKSLDEVKKALLAHGFWNADARVQMTFRKMRVKLKQLFSRLGLQGLIRLWRKWKWNSQL